MGFTAKQGRYILASIIQTFPHASFGWGPPAGAIVAGKEVDELIGSATLQIRGDVAARLLRGERCTLPVVLGGGASKDQQSVATSMDLLVSDAGQATNALSQL